MAEAPHFFYETTVEWKSEKEGTVAGAGLPPVKVGAPPEFKGHAGNWSPEHLLVASVNTCFMLTLLAIAENSKVPLISFFSSAKGKLEKVSGAGYQLTEIVVNPRVVIATSEYLERMPRILEKAKENCFITNSIKSRVTLVPEIFHRQTPASPYPLGVGPSAAPVSKETKPR
jgi:peroxiredoxin-like protein